MNTQFFLLERAGEAVPRAGRSSGQLWMGAADAGEVAGGPR